MAVDILIIRNNCDTATEWTNWIGQGLKGHLEGKGHSVTDLSDAEASPENVHHWLNSTDARTRKLAVAFDHGGTTAFYGEKNNQVTPVITKSNAEDLTKELHVYTFACSTNAANGVGQTAVEKGCFSWLGYIEPVYVITKKYPPLRDCIWSYIDALADGKTLEQAEAILRQAYKDRFTKSWIFKYNLERLLLRKKQNGMTINSHNRVRRWQKDKRVNGLYAHGPGNRAAWVHFQGLGWRRLWHTHDAQIVSMMAMAAQAKAKNRRVDFLENEGRVETIYVF